MTKASHQTGRMLADIASALRAAANAKLATAVERVCDSAANAYGYCPDRECDCVNPDDEWFCPPIGCGLTAATDYDYIEEAKRLRYAPWVISPHLFDDATLTADEVNLIIKYLALEARRRRMEARRRSDVAAEPIIGIRATAPDSATVPILRASVTSTARVLANAMLTPVRRE